MLFPLHAVTIYITVAHYSICLSMFASTLPQSDSVTNTPKLVLVNMYLAFYKGNLYKQEEEVCVLIPLGVKLQNCQIWVVNLEISN